MTHRYVWFDDVEATEVVRVELRMPRALRDFLRDVAKTHQVSMNSTILGILAYAADADAHKRLVIRKVNDVRVTESGPASNPVTVPLLDAGPGGHVTYNPHKVP